MTAEAEKLEKRARNVLLYQLSRSMKTEHQLREIMIRREIPAEIFEPLLERFKEAQLIDDTEFARAFVASRTRAGKSVNAIRRELRNKGVEQRVIAVATELISVEDEVSRASELAQAKLARMSALEPMVARRRLQGFLARRGYSSQVISAAMRQSGVSG
jgi:regulatory protein